MGSLGRAGLEGTGKGCTLSLGLVHPDVSTSLLFLELFAKGPGLAPLPFLSVCLWGTGNMPHSSYSVLNHGSILTVLQNLNSLGPTG